ncbi:MAG: transposase domain-containing protein [Tistlia sp.]|uniref:transposase domain-containing protein n=1 Tax=Tistlia sp. TaxID=3057121 RepID=UPI0034A3F286
MTLAKEWFTAAELAELRLPEVPGTARGVLELAKRQRWQERKNAAGAPLARRRKGRGGGWEYHEFLLPDAARAKLVADDLKSKRAADAEPSQLKDPLRTPSPELWRWFNSLPDSRKAVARERLRLIQAVDLLYRGGLPKNLAVAEVARREKIGGSTIYEWMRTLRGVDPADRLPSLAPRHKGKTETAECDPRAWDLLKALYLHNSKPGFEACFREVELSARDQGWTIPNKRTLRRRIEAIWHPIVVFHREGAEGLKRLYPPLERDRSHFHALEAVNADFHTFDITVAMPGAEAGARPSLIAIQDLYSNKILAWRVDLNPSSAAVRLAFHDVFKAYGIPRLAVLDNGREFAAKLITGGQKTRYRNKIKPEECEGLLTAVGVEVRWALPYSGQSKPIERAFGDFCESISKHRAFEGAYTGNSPAAKPANYGSKVVPFETFMAVVARGIELHNAREGRRTKVCGGTKSFDQAFQESYATAAIRQAEPEHLQLALMTAEAVTARKPTGALHVLGNRFWSPWLNDQIGRTLTVRYDPDDVQAGLQVFRADGAYLGFAECWHAVGFDSADAAKKQARDRGARTKLTRELAALERSMDQDEVMRLLAKPEEAPAPEAKVVRPLRMTGNTALAMKPEPDTTPDQVEEMERNLSASIARLAEYRRQEP